jgi:hypothetical protein
MRLVVVVVALFCAYLTGNRMAHPFIDGDLYWQAHLGEYVLNHLAIPTALGPETFTAAGAPWTAHEWLLGVIVALAFRYDASWTLSVLAGLAVFVALTLTALRAKRAGASLYATLSAMLFAGICLEAPFAIRAQVLAWPLLAALLFALDSEGFGALLAIPIVIAWANVHASVMIAIPIVWVDAACFILLRLARARGQVVALEKSTRTKKRAAAVAAAERPNILADAGVRARLILVVAAPLAVLCTPLGMRLPEYAWFLMHSPIRQFIAEWQPLTGPSTQVVAGMVPLLGIVLIGAGRLWRERPRDFVLTFLMAVLAVVSIRNIALFAIVAAVPASLSVAVGEGWHDPLELPRYAALTVVGLLLAPVLGWIAFRANPITKVYSPPLKSIALLAQQPGDHRLLCTEFSWCAAALDEPNVRVFLDSRADPYPLPVWRSFAMVSAVIPGWQGELRRYDVNAVIVEKDSPLVQGLRGTPGWQVASESDSCCILFTRKT